MRDALKRRDSTWGLDDLLDRYPALSRRPSDCGDLMLAGTLDYQAVHPSFGTITDSFVLDFRIPPAFPRSIPTVRETAGRIPRDYHRLADGELCLGSPLRLLLTIAEHPTLIGFVERCVLPYLVRFTIYERTGNVPFGELAHGNRGLLDDYRQLLRARSDHACVRFMTLLGMKKRVANKLPCPCESGRRFGRCHHRQLNRLRMIAPRFYYTQAAAELSRKRS